MSILYIKSIFRKRKVIILYLIIITILLSIISIMCDVTYSVDNLIKKNINERIDNKSLFIETLQKKDIIEINKVCKKIGCEKIISYFNPITIYNDKSGYFIINKYFNQNIKIISGRIPIENKNEIILPNKILIDDKVYNLEKYLGEKIKIQLNDESVSTNLELNVVGIFENLKKTTINEGYATLSDNYVNSNNYIVILNNEKLVDEYVKILSKKKYRISRMNNSSEINTYSQIQIVIKTIGLIVGIITLILMILTINKFIKEQRKNIAIIKILGFKTTYILLIFYILIITLFCIAGLLSYLLTGIITSVLVTFLGNVYNRAEIENILKITCVYQIFLGISTFIQYKKISTTSSKILLKRDN